MVNGFKTETKQLTEYEFKLVPLIVAGLKTKIGEKNAITAGAMVRAMKDRKHKLSGPRLRKIINYIRTNDLISCLVANSKGYYIENDPDEIQKFIDSLTQRAGAIINVRNALIKQLNK